MDRINSYRNLVRLKIKAKQTDDLLRTVNSDRIVSRDMAQFYMQFDKAFLGLYPHFVDDFTKLLQPDYQVSLNKDGSLTTELRIFAFIRLGVTESSEIATDFGILMAGSALASVPIIIILQTVLPSSNQITQGDDKITL